MASTTAYVQYGNYRFSPVPQIGYRDSGAPLGSSKSGPVIRERVITIVGKILGLNFNDIQSRVWAMEAAFAQQDQVLIWNDGTTQRISANVKVTQIDVPVEWGTYEANFTITLLYYPQDDVNAAPFEVSYNGYTFNPIPVFSRNMDVARESPDSIRLANRWVISLSGFIDKGSMAANMTEYNALLTAINSDNGTLKYGNFTQSVKITNSKVEPDTWQSVIKYSLTMIYSDNYLAGGIIILNSSRRIQRFTQRNAKHLIPFIDFGNIQLLGESPQTVSAQGFIVADTLAHARTAANTEINNQFPAPPIGGAAIEEPSSTIVERATENRVEWNVSVFYTIPAFTGAIYGSG